MTIYHTDDTIKGDGDEYEGEREEEDQGYFSGVAVSRDRIDVNVNERLPLRSHIRFEDNGYWEANDQQVSNYIARAHGNQLSVALPTFRSWVWDYLPIVAERLAFRDGRNEYSDEGNG